MGFPTKRRTSFSSPRRPIPLWLKLFIGLIVAITLATSLNFGIQFLTSNLSNGPAQINVPELWSKGSYDEILTFSKDFQNAHPLDSESLIFSGFSLFQKAVAEETVEKSIPLIDQSIATLRRALVSPNFSKQPKVYYILGKAYYIKGKYYADLAVRFLKKSLDMGFVAPDTNEFLGLAYNRLGKFSDAIQYFLKTAETNPSDTIEGVIGETYLQMGNLNEAAKHLTNALNKTKDRSRSQQWHFRLGEIYTKTGSLDKAIQEYQEILALNPNSADAHFFLGEIYLQQDKKDEAKREWVKAFKIAPEHFGANQRIFNK